MSIMIIVALVVVPTKLENLASLWFERKHLGGIYDGTKNDQHVVLCCNNLEYDTLSDFLKEFYAHRRNQVIRLGGLSIDKSFYLSIYRI